MFVWLSTETSFSCKSFDIWFILWLHCLYFQGLSHCFTADCSFLWSCISLFDIICPLFYVLSPIFEAKSQFVCVCAFVCVCVHICAVLRNILCSTAFGAIWLPEHETFVAICNPLKRLFISQTETDIHYHTRVSHKLQTCIVWTQLTFRKCLPVVAMTHPIHVASSVLLTAKAPQQWLALHTGTETWT